MGLGASRLSSLTCSVPAVPAWENTRKLKKTRENSRKLEKTRENSSKFENSRELEKTREENSRNLKRTRENSRELERTRENSEELERTRENSRKLERTRENSREPERTRDNSRELKRTRENSRGLERTRENSRELESTRVNSTKLEKTRMSSRKHLKKLFKKTVSASQELCTTWLCSLHSENGYSRVHTSIHIYIYIYIPRYPRSFLQWLGSLGALRPSYQPLGPKKRRERFSLWDYSGSLFCIFSDLRFWKSHFDCRHVFSMNFERKFWWMLMS